MNSCGRAVRAARLLGLGVIVLAALSGCGSSGSAPIASANATELRQAVNSIRGALARQDAPRARAAVAALERDITRLATNGQLSRADAQALKTEARQVLARIPTQVKPATEATSTTTAAPSPAKAKPATPTKPAKPAPHPGHPKPPGHAPGHGHGGGKGG